MKRSVDRRTFLRVAGGVTLGLTVGVPLLGAEGDLFPGLSAGSSLSAPTIGWRAAAEEAIEGARDAYDQFLDHLREVGGVDDPRDVGRLLPLGDAISMTYVPPRPYELAQMVERQRSVRDRKRDAVWSSTPCTPSEVSALSTGQIRSRLASLGIGIDATPVAFASLVQETVSPWAISARWLRGRELPAPERDFVALAAWELWQRTSPRPDDEKLDEVIHCVLPESDRGDRAGACMLGLRAWQQLRVRWSPETTTGDAADELWAGSVPIANVLPALSRRLHEESRNVPPLRPVVFTVVDHALGQFRDDDGLLKELHAIRAALV